MTKKIFYVTLWAVAAESPKIMESGMEDESSNLNIEWKKNQGFGATEKLTRKIDKQKALPFEATEKKAVNTTFSAKPTELPKGLKKIRKKIKEVYDEDEDEDFYDGVPHDLNNSLMNALYEDEKKQLQQKETLNNQKMQQTAGRLEAVAVADKLARESGLKGLDKKVAGKNLSDVTLINSSLEKVLSEEVALKTKSGVRKLSKGETVTMLRGITRIRKMALAADESQLKALEKMKVEDIINAGEKSTDDAKVAELILKKSGRKSKKDVNKIVEKSKKQKDIKIKNPKPKDKYTSKQKLNLSAKDIFRD